MATTFGIEEEFALLDPGTLDTVDRASDAVDALGGEPWGIVSQEFFPSQVEFATPIAESAADAFVALSEFRRRLADWAADAGVVVASTGTPFRARAHRAVSPGTRYASIVEHIGALTDEHQINGLHVHVGIPDADAGVRASNFLRPWLPVLLAVSANSPFWHGRDTGFDSWRAIHGRRWTTSGIPPRFRDAAEYRRTIAQLTGIGVTSDEGTINWNVRLSHRYPTLEVRVFDAQLDLWSAVGFALIVRALVTAGIEEGDTGPGSFGAVEPWDAALWHAARYGLSDRLVHPVSGRLVSAASAVRALHDRVAPRLDRIHGELVSDLLARVLWEGNGAALQRQALRGGLLDLADLYRTRLIASPLAVAPAL
jgi:carboxylate-amine ligase